MRTQAVGLGRVPRMGGRVKAAAVACALVWPAAAHAQTGDFDIEGTRAQLQTMRAAVSQLDELIVTLDDRLVELLDRMDATEDQTARARMRESADAMTDRLDRAEALQASLSVQIEELDAALARFSQDQEETVGMPKGDENE